MPTENKPAKPFQREDRYIVLKLNRLPKDETEYLRDCQAKAMIDCVVVEHDWPEYHLVWAMIEHRMAGKPVPDFNLWRRTDELQQRLNAADQRIDELEQDKARLDAIEANFWDVRHQSSSLADTGDYTSSIEIIGHWMDRPTERVIGENYSENLRAAIDQAMAAPAYPPARPEYPDIESDQNDDWHMNPCKQGHRDVGAAGGVAHCYTCDEKITATTTHEAFELWNASHPQAEESD